MVRIEYTKNNSRESDTFSVFCAITPATQKTVITNKNFILNRNYKQPNNHKN